METITNPNGEISSNLQTINYTPFNKVSFISESNNQLNISYGPDQQRVQSDLVDANTGARTTIYYANGYEKEVTGGNTTEINYLNGGDGLCAIYVLQNGVGNMYFVYKDYLGSILTLTDENGNMFARQSFDAWGKPRNANDWSNNQQTSFTSPFWLRRGYTGHEHLPQFSLINMNGRVYDPVIGRILSPDNFVTDITSSQAFNRYSYCKNNPLNRIDKSGEWEGWDDLAAIIVGAATNVATNWDYIDPNHTWSGIHWGAFLAYAGAGAAGGEATLYGGPALGFAVGGALTVGVDVANPNGNINNSDNHVQAIGEEFLKGGISALAGGEAGAEAAEVAENAGLAEEGSMTGSGYTSAGDKFGDFLRGPKDWSWSNVLEKAAYKGGIEILKDFAKGNISLSDLNDPQKSGDAFNAMTSDFAKGFVTSFVSDGLDNILPRFSKVTSSGNKLYGFYKIKANAYSNLFGTLSAYGLSNFMYQNNVFGTSGNANSPNSLYDAFDVSDFTGIFIESIYAWGW